jgi:lipopolysaccharide assembly outer membrane protein LptD (OstA)
MESAPVARVQKLLSAMCQASVEVIRSRAARVVQASALAFVIVATLQAHAEPAPQLDVQGMTFVASRENNDAVILRAEHARFDTVAKKAYLTVVNADVPSSAEQEGFKMRCDESVVDLATNDFEATGNVHGEVDDGTNFEAEWVRYNHLEGVLYSDGPVVMIDGGTKVLGGGFRYDIAKRRFKLLGGAKILRDAEEGLGR